MEPPYIICIWDDCWGDSTTGVTLKDVDDTHKPTQMETRGWLLKEDDKGISIAAERCLDPGQETYYRGRSFILKANIKSTTAVKLSRPRRPKPEPIPP